MATGSFVDIQLNPCFENGTQIKNEERHPILSERNNESQYTEEVYSGEYDNDLSHASYKSQQSCEEERDAPFPPQRKRFEPFVGHSFSVIIVVVELLGICCLVTVICWVAFFHGGLGWDGGIKEFNWHPVCTVAGMIFCYANAAISSYVLRNHSETAVHYLHGISLLLTFIFTTVGMVSALSTSASGYLTFYTFHSWLGLMTMILFTAQVVVGFIGLFPKCENMTRKRYLGVQVWIALLVLSSSVTSCLLGISEKMAITNLSMTSFSYERMLGNVCSLLLVLFTCMVSCILLHPMYRRP